jgi:hypothetical protein
MIRRPLQRAFGWGTPREHARLPKRADTVRLNFTKRRIENLAPEEERQAYYDLRTPDLGLRVSPSGRKSFFWFRQVRGKPTFKALGAFPGTTIEVARAAATELSGKLDGLKRRERIRRLRCGGTRSGLTLGQLVEELIIETRRFLQIPR